MISISFFFFCVLFVVCSIAHLVVAHPSRVPLHRTSDENDTIMIFQPKCAANTSRSKKVSQ